VLWGARRDPSRHTKLAVMLLDNQPSIPHPPSLICTNPPNRHLAICPQGNHSGALNAYTRALQLDPPHPAPLLANRAACHIKLGDAAACHADCSAALEIVRGRLKALEAAGALGGAGGLAAAAAAAAQMDPVVANRVVLPEVARSAAVAAPTAERQPPPQQQPEPEALRHLLVKLLARRAIASVQLANLPSAEADLIAAMRYDPDNARLEADLGEVRAAMMVLPAASIGSSCSACSASSAGECSSGAAAAPGDSVAVARGAIVGGPASGAVEVIKARAEARFKLRDFEGAAEAFGALLRLQRQQVKVQQDDGGAEEERQLQGLRWAACGVDGIVRTLANRAACWLPLERYESCLADCCTALNMLRCSQESGSGCGGQSEAVFAAESVLTAARLALARKSGDDTSSNSGNSSEDTEAASPLEPITIAARLVARMALASGCLKRGAEARQLYSCAQELYRLVGDEEQVGRLQHDQEKLLGQ